MLATSSDNVQTVPLIDQSATDRNSNHTRAQELQAWLGAPRNTDGARDAISPPPESDDRLQALRRTLVIIADRQLVGFDALRKEAVEEGDQEAVDVMDAFLQDRTMLREIDATADVAHELFGPFTDRDRPGLYHEEAQRFRSLSRYRTSIRSQPSRSSFESRTRFRA